MGSYAIVQTAGGDLIRVAPDGSQLPLPLPPGVTVSPYQRVRGAVFNRRVILVNGVSRNIQLDENLIPRILTPRPPQAAPVANTGGAGSVTGTYVYRYTFAITSGDRVLSESEMSPPSAAVTVAAQNIALTSVGLSSDPGVNARRIYRTANGPGDEYYLVAQVPDNSTTAYTDDKTDEETLLFPAEDLGSPPGFTEQDRMEAIVVWRDRGWGPSSLYPDRLYYSGNRLQYAWPNYVVIQPEGSDLAGITGLAPRRDELMVGRRRALWSIVGDIPARFQAICRVPSVGIWATDSTAIVDNTVYFLGEFGVYTWGDDGLRCISSEKKVEAWFKGDDYFNREYLHLAIGVWNRQEDTYDLFLPAAGSTALDRWVSFDIRRRAWYGPHVTAAVASLGAATNLESSADRLELHVGGSDGVIYRMNRETRTDGADTPIVARAAVAHHHDGRPDDTKVWGRLTVHTKKESAGTLTIERRVGDLDAPSGPQSVVSLTRVDTVATVTTAAPHLLGDGEDVLIFGADQAEYNGTVRITVTGPTTFTFSVAGSPATPATGTIAVLHPMRANLVHLLTKDRSVPGRLGVGRYCQLTFENAEVGQNVELRGYEVDPVVVKGRR